jgi:RNA 3'-terminal phosphate cyclase (ATP)
MADRARSVLTQEGLPAQVEPRRLKGTGPGAGITLLTEYESAIAGFTAYGRKGLPAEHVAEAACEELLAHHRQGAPVDPYLADQLVLPAALAEGESRIVTSQVTQHLVTNVWTVSRFLERDLRLSGEPGAPGALTVSDAG